MSISSTLSPVETLYEASPGPNLPLPDSIAQIYGPLNFPEHPGKPYVISNFVTSLDGVVTLGIPGHSGGGDISGFNPEDKFLMGLLRAIADIVIISTGILAVAPNQVWTAEAVFPAMAKAYRELRAALGKKTPPITVIVTSHGEFNHDIPIFRSEELPVVILTTQQGARRVSALRSLANVEIMAVKPDGLIQAAEMTAALQTIAPEGIYLMEAGPHLHGEFIAGRLLNEIFLTLSPQVVGRIGADIRPGLVADRLFAPDSSVWGTLYSIKRSKNHLFLRYGLPAA